MMKMLRRIRDLLLDAVAWRIDLARLRTGAF
jgi:hypothetical protein